MDLETLQQISVLDPEVQELLQKATVLSAWLFWGTIGCMFLGSILAYWKGKRIGTWLFRISLFPPVVIYLVFVKPERRPRNSTLDELKTLELELRAISQASEVQTKPTEESSLKVNRPQISFSKNQNPNETQLLKKKDVNK